MSLAYRETVLEKCRVLMRNSASSLGIMSEDEKRVQRIEDIKGLLS